MHRARVLAILLVAAGATSPGVRAAIPAARRADPRILTLNYDPDAIVALNAIFGFQMMITFGPDERIENVSIGDGAAWQVTPNKKASLLFVKPVDLAQRTNMTVVTDRRSYLFELNASRAGVGYTPTPYVVRFTYPRDPEKAVPPPTPPERRNVAYSYTGSRASLPALVFDDGRFTYFKWPEGASIPALFVVGADGAESIVNYGVRDGYQVVEQVSARFVLRDGHDVTYVINEAWREPPPAAGSPRPHDAKTARAAARGEAPPR